MAAELKPVYLLAGSDRPKLNRALARLRGRFSPDAVERMSATSANADEAVARCNALGLFGDTGRLVEVSEVEVWKAPEAKVVAAYLKSPTPGTVLALAAEAIKPDSALAKACRQAGEVLIYDVSRRDLPKWVAEQFERIGAHADSSVCRALVELVGENLAELDSEIAKLATWADGQEILEDSLPALVAARAEASSFALTDAWGRRDVAAALGACEAHLEGVGDPRRELTRLAGQLASHVRRVRDCQSLEAAGKTPREAAVELKRHPYYVEKLFGHSRNFGGDELSEAIVGLASLDLALKGKSRLSGELELERTIVEITRPAEAAGSRGLS